MGKRTQTAAGGDEDDDDTDPATPPGTGTGAPVSGAAPSAGGPPPRGLKNRVRATYTRNRILIWACILICVNQLGFGSIVPILPLYAETFGVSKALIGMTIAVYGLARFLMNVPTSAIADKYGRRQALALGGAVTVAGNLLSAVAGTYWLFLGGRFIAGAGAAMVITGTQIIVADISEKATRGRTMSIYMGTFMFAVGLGPLPGGVLGEYVSLSAPFYVYCVLGGVVGLLAWFKVPETRGLRASQGEAPAPSMRFTAQLRLLTSQLGFTLIAIVSFFTFFARTGAIFNLIPTLADNKIGLSSSQIGLGLAMISLVGLLFAYPSGVLVDKLGRKAVIVPSTLLSGAALVLFAFAPNFPMFVLACGTWAAASGIASAAPAAYAADMAPAGMNASAMGMYRMLADFGYVAGPLLLGAAADLFTTEAALIGTAVPVVAAGMVFMLKAPETHRAVRRRTAT